MRLCTVCDKKIEGKWCKNCHRFVKSYELPGRIFLNESHDATNDKGCTYHDVQESSPVTYGKGAKASGTYATGSTGTSAGKNIAGKRSGKKVAAAVGAFYAVVAAIGIIGNVMSEVQEGQQEEIQAEFPDYVYDDLFATEQNGIDPELETLLMSAKEKLEAIEQLQPVEVSSEADYEFRYYEPEELKALNIPCSEAHFPMTVSRLDLWLRENWTDLYETEEDVSPYYNYLYLDAEYMWLTFASFRDYYAGDDFAIRANYDTVTEQLHMIGFVSTMENDSMDLCFSVLKELDPNTDLSLEQFRSDVETVLKSYRDKAKEDPEAVEYVTFYQSETLEADCEVKDGMYSVSFYPAYVY